MEEVSGKASLDFVAILSDSVCRRLDEAARIERNETNRRARICVQSVVG